MQRRCKGKGYGLPGAAGRCPLEYLRTPKVLGRSKAQTSHKMTARHCVNRASQPKCRIQAVARAPTPILACYQYGRFSQQCKVKTGCHRLDYTMPVSYASDTPLPPRSQPPSPTPQHSRNLVSPKSAVILALAQDTSPLSSLSVQSRPHDGCRRLRMPSQDISSSRETVPYPIMCVHIRSLAYQQLCRRRLSLRACRVQRRPVNLR